MSFWTRYISYIKDNPENYWFKAKAYGWGWVPATWEGWLTLGVFLAVFVFLIMPLLNNPQPSDRDVSLFLAQIFLWALALLLVCYKTGEPPKWQWGIPEK